MLPHSPLRRAGGQIQLISHMREQLDAIRRPRLAEPFCSDGIVGLTAMLENQRERCVMIDPKPGVAGF